MRKRLLIVTAVTSLLGVLAQGPASAAPTPKYGVSCVVGGLTTADYGRVRVTEVTFTWLDSGNSSFKPMTVDITKKGHHGSAFSTTAWDTSGGGDVPVTVTATFTNADGTTGEAQAGCTTG